MLMWGLPVKGFVFGSEVLNDQMQGAAIRVVGLLVTLVQAYWDKPSQRLQRTGVFVVALACALWVEPPTRVWFTFLPFAAFLASRLAEVFHDELHMRGVWLLATSIYLVYCLLCHNVMLVISEGLVIAISASKMLQIRATRRAAAAG